MQRRDLVQGWKTMRKELIQPTARSTDPAVGGQQAASSGRHQATGHIFATSQDRAASRSTKFVVVAAPNMWTNSKVKNILVLRGILSFGEDYSRSAFPKEIISKTRVILWWRFLRGKCVVNLSVILSFWDYFFWVIEALRLWNLRDVFCVRVFAWA